MKRALDEQHKEALKPPPPVTPPPVTPPVEKHTSKRGLKVAGLTVAGLGVAACAVGGGMLGLSASDSSTLHRVAVNGMPWTTMDQQIFDEGDHAQTAGIVLLSAGGALVVAGAITFAVALRK